MKLSPERNALLLKIPAGNHRKYYRKRMKYLRKNIDYWKEMMNDYERGRYCSWIDYEGEIKQNLISDEKELIELETALAKRVDDGCPNHKH